MRVISKNVQTGDLSQFEKVGSSREKVHLTKDGTLKAGTTWKGRLISLLETFGIFQDYCTKAKLDLAKDNRHAAWSLWHALKEKYGLDNAREALATTSPLMHGMDGVKVRHGIITHARMGEPGTLTCGEVATLIRRTKAVARMRKREMEGLHKHAPQTPREAAYYDTKDEHTAGLSDAIQNHQRVKEFVGKRENLLYIMQQIGADTGRLKQSRVDYIMAKLLMDIEQINRDGVFTREQIYKMTERTLKESLEHRASWCRAQAIKIGTKKRMMSETAFSRDLAALEKRVMDTAKATITTSYVQELAHDHGLSIPAHDAEKIAKATIQRVQKRVTDERMDVTPNDFRKMVSDAIADRFGDTQ